MCLPLVTVVTIFLRVSLCVYHSYVIYQFENVQKQEYNRDKIATNLVKRKKKVAFVPFSN